MNLKYKVWHLEENIGTHLFDIDLHSYFLDVIPKAQARKEKIKWDYTCELKICTSEETIKYPIYFRIKDKIGFLSFSPTFTYIFPKICVSVLYLSLLFTKDSFINDKLEIQLKASFCSNAFIPTSFSLKNVIILITLFYF